MKRKELNTIVAEIGKNWPNSNAGTFGKTVSMLFEDVINHNDKRGYTLDSWRFSQVMTGPDRLTETIIAVFVKRVRTQ